MARKSCSLDPIPSTLLKSCFSDLLPVIANIINLSFESAKVPIPMKLASISPRLKKQSLDTELYPNFRPVSNLRFISKANEKVAAMQLWDYVGSNGLSEEFQSAYTQYHSCETALLRVQNDVLEAIDKHNCVFLLLLDLSAAFDTVDHTILLKRLNSRFAVRGKALSWLESYLANRSQFVQIDDASSSVRPLHFGVPQSSVLGPILYLLYTSPLGDIIREHDLSFHLYADDTQLYTSFSCKNTHDFQVAKQRLESCISDITLWMTANKLKLNNGKSELLLLHSQFRPTPTLPSLTVGEKIIRPTNKARNLGVLFDETMSFSPHVNAVVKGAFYHIRNIAKIRKYIDKKTTEVLIHSFVSSKLDFCNSLLHGAQGRDIAKLQSAQNAAARVVTCLRKNDHITETLKELHWLPIEYRIIFKINLITFKSLNSLGPRYLKNLLTFYRQKRLLRSSKDHLRLVEPAFNMKTYGQHAFSTAAPRLWNKLPLDIRASSNVETFKLKLKTFLFKKAYC